MRILLAEDDKSLSNAICTILKYNNYSVDAVYDGQEALDYLESNIYDAVVLDLMMPKVDGISVLKQLRRNKNNIPVLILTAKSEVEDKVLGLDCGADDYLTKPFATNELLARIRAITRRSESFNDNSLTLGNTKLNRTTFELSTPTNTILLTSKEFQIMEMLLLNHNQIVQSESLLDKIWAYEGDISIVWSYISYLRKKLVILNADINIKAIRNIGYKLEIKNDKEA